MAALVDTSIWIDIFRDRTGNRRQRLMELLDGREVFLSRFTQLELLQGALDESEWSVLAEYLEGQDYVSVSEDIWENAARIYFELHRIGETVRSAIDCCIAQSALDEDLVLIHRDRDFNAIAKVRALQHIWVDW